jgi:DNA-binding NtrC family response regulator
MEPTNGLSKALVINSDPDDRKFLEEMLNEHGYQVKGVARAYEAAQLFREEAFSLIIGELGFPEFEGMKILDLVRRFESQAKVVLIAPQVGAEVFIKARARGAFDCLDKPLERSMLEQVLAAIRN